MGRPGVGEDAAAGEPVMSPRPGERVCDRLVANHMRDRRPYDGYLYVTTDRLVWQPWPLAQKQGVNRPGVSGGSGLAGAVQFRPVVYSACVNWLCRERLWLSYNQGRNHVNRPSHAISLRTSQA